MVAEQSGLRAFAGGLRGGLTWRVLVLWALLSLLPAALVALPLDGLLGQWLDHSVYAAEWARHLDDLAVTDLMIQLGRHGGFVGELTMLGLVLAFLLSPFLTGMYVASARAGRVLGFGDLIGGGLREYGRMFRMLLLALVVLVIAATIGGLAFDAASEHADQAVTEAAADFGNKLALWAMGIVLLIAHATIESGRAQFAADPTLRSVLRGWWRGVKQLLRRPFSTFGIYLVITVIGLLLFALVAALRGRLVGFSLPMVAVGFLVTQVGVMVLAWMRGARLLGLAGLADGRSRGATAGTWSV